MLNSISNALGIIFPNTYDQLLPELVTERTTASIPFGGRYRMIDFMLSSMANCGVDNVTILVRKNYHSLMDHIGAGREWDLTRKRGGLNIIPPYSEKNVKIYNGRVEALAGVLSFLEEQREKYVILSDAFQAVNFDFSKLIDAHEESGADVTLVYNEAPIPEGAKEDNFTLNIDETGRVTEMLFGDYHPNNQNLSMNIYVMDRELLIGLVRNASARGMVYFEREILARDLNVLNVRAYKYEGYVARLADMKSYFDENMRLLKPENMEALFSADSPIYTKIRDDNPTRYITGSTVKNCVVADGCVIEGEVENSVLFRGVHIKKGAKVKNCVLMQDTRVESDAEVEYLVSDKDVTITSGKKLSGTNTFPVYVAKGHTI